MTTHIRRRGSLRQRYNAHEGSGWLRQRLATWASDSKTTIPQLRSALGEVLESGPRPEWDADAVRFGYLELMRSLERPIPPSRREELGWEYSQRLGEMQLSPSMVGRVEAARRFLLREPERSRRTLQLLCANWLAHLESREVAAPKPAVRASFSVLTSTNPVRRGAIIVPLYPVGP